MGLTHHRRYYNEKNVRIINSKIAEWFSEEEEEQKRDTKQAMGHFRVILYLSFKTSLCAKPFI